MLTFNELNGEEVKHVVGNRFEQFLDTVTHFQRHMTMPRLRITTQIKLEIWADQPSPDVVPLSDRFDVVVEHTEPAEVITGEAVDSTAPTDGHPPDQVREMHGLPLSAPSRGSREIGGQIAVADQYGEAQASESLTGLKIHRTGSADPMSGYATVAVIDQGPAGLSHGQMNREPFHLSRGVPSKRQQ
jgi:hypothetical protein